jgi:hypothetical protein
MRPLVLYRCSGFSKADHKKNYYVVVECEDLFGDPLKEARAIAGEDVLFCSSMNLSGTEAGVVNADREHLLNQLLDGKVLDDKFDAARKIARKEYLAQRRALKKARANGNAA